MMATRDGFPQVAKYLLDAGADVFGARDMFGRTALDLATEFARGQPIRFGQGETMEEARPNQSSFTLSCRIPSQGILRKTSKVENRRTSRALITDVNYPPMMTTWTRAATDTKHAYGESRCCGEYALEQFLRVTSAVRLSVCEYA
jgi:hypothetical protein